MHARSLGIALSLSLWLVLTFSPDPARASVEPSEAANPPKRGQALKAANPLRSFSKETTIAANFPAAPLRQNLFLLAKQLELSIFFAEETVAGLEADAIDEEITVTAVLDRWLSPHCLEADFIREKFVTIGPATHCQPTQDVAPVTVSEVPTPTPRPPLMEELFVHETAYTGSRLRQVNFNRAMPVDIIDQQEILLSGLQTVSELLRYVPAVSGNSTSTLISNGGDGSASITLRGLPASNTLVLLNGRRTNYNALSGDAVNLNTLPLSMVERIEILKDGVSAIYGADAVAGVVNVITKRNLEGTSIDAYHGISEAGDLNTSQIAVQTGFEKENWFASLNLSAYQQDGIFSRNRDLSASSDDRARGGIDKRSSATVPALVITPGGVLRLADGAPGGSISDFIAASSEDRFEYRDFTSSVVPLDRYSAYGTIGYTIDEKWQIGADAFFSYTSADTHFGQVPVFTGFESIPLTVGANNPYNPFGMPLDDVRRRVVELPARRQRNQTTSSQWVLHAKYQSDRHSVAMALQHDHSRAEDTKRFGLRADRLAEALGDNCVAPCVPFNLLGPAGSITDPMLAYVRTGNVDVHGTSTLTGLTIDLDWHPNEQVAVAAGIEARRERLVVNPDQILTQQLQVAGGNQGATRGDRSVAEFYGELYLPLLTGSGERDTLGLQLAARLSHYSDFGNVNNPRIVLNWLPTTEWSVRMSWGKGFRAPTLPQLHSSGTQSFQQLNDPCSVIDPMLNGCAQQSDPSLNQFLTVTGGSNDLKPERSETMTLGARWSKSIDQLSSGFNLDLFSISQHDVVDSSAQFIVNQNARNLSFANRIARDANGNLTRVLATLQNIGSRDVRGFDIGANIKFDTPPSARIDVALNATRILSFKDKFDPDSPTIDKAGTFTDEASEGLGSLPDWKVSLAARANVQHWQLHYSIYWVSSLTEDVPLSKRQRTIESWTTHNLNVSYFGPVTAWTRATLGVQNLFDEAPPFSAAAFNDSYDGRTYDITGRYFFVKLDRAF